MTIAHDITLKLSRFLTDTGGRVSYRTIGLILRSVYGLKVSDHNIRGWLLDDTAANRGAAAANTHERRGGAAAGRSDEEKGSPPHPRSQENIYTPSLRSGEPPRRRRKSDRDSVVDIAWRNDVLEAARHLVGREMRSWTPDERYTWARWHALMFAYCNKDEGNNRRMATKIAAALLNMASSKFGDMTGREYFHLATRVHERRNKAPWYDPWLIKSEMEIAE